MSATATDSFKTMTDTFSKSFDAGVRMQEDAFRMVTDMSTRATEEFRNRVEKMADDVLPMSKKNMDRFQRMFDETAQRATNLVRTSMDLNPAVRPVATPAEIMDRTFSMWKASFDAARETMDAMQKMTTEVVADWQSATKCCGSTTCQTPAAGEPKKAAK